MSNFWPKVTKQQTNYFKCFFNIIDFIVISHISGFILLVVIVWPKKWAVLVILFDLEHF